MAKLFKVFVNIILVIVIILLLGYFVLRVTDKIEIYNVKTGSMEEKIHAGDYILIFRKSSYNVGDVVTYTSDDGFITHRIIKKEGSKITTKGDANNTEDNEIIESSIVGKVIISGGVLNILIEYKYILVCLLLSLYLFSCYFGGDEKEDFEFDKEENELPITEETNGDNNLDFESEKIIEEETKDINLVKNNDVEIENNNLEEIDGLIKIDNKEDNDINELKKKKTTNSKTKKKENNSKKNVSKKETKKNDSEKNEELKK